MDYTKRQKAVAVAVDLAIKHHSGHDRDSAANAAQVAMQVAALRLSDAIYYDEKPEAKKFFDELQAAVNEVLVRHLKMLAEIN